MAKKVQVRILVDVVIDSVNYRPNQVVEIEDAKATALVKDRVGDASKQSIAYALSLPGAKVIEHAIPDAESADPAVD